MDEQQARHQLIKIAHRLYDKGFVTATEGNISQRIGTNRFIFTPSGICKGDLVDDDLLLCDEKGNPLAKGQVTSEAPMHLEVYRRRDEINAVIHAHPPYVVALNLAGVEIDTKLLPETIMILGDVPTAPFATPSTDEGAPAIRGLIEKYNAIILDRHGSLTVGTTILQAYHRLEVLEFAARVIYMAKALSKPKVLSKKEIDRIKGAGVKFKS